MLRGLIGLTLVYYLGRVGNEGMRKVPAFETEQLDVEDLFSDAYVFKFPLYQRPYRWGTQHAEALVNDLLDACGDGGGIDTLPAYFIGSIVLVRQSEREHLVIDGRQRLTTIAILLGVMRDLERRESERRELRDMLFDEERKVAGTPAGPRLDVKGVDGDCLNEWVMTDGATARGVDEVGDVPDRVAAVIEIISLLRQRLLGLDEAQRTRLRDFLIRRCEVVAVITSDENQGLRIFQILNTRGLPLSDVDLIKPDVLTPLSREEQEAAIRNWDEAEMALGADGMSRLLRALYVIYARRMPSDDPKKFHEEFITAVAARGHQKVVLEDIPAYGDLLVQIEEGEIPSEGDADPNRLMLALNWLNWTSEDYMPVALEILMRCGDDIAKAYRWLQGLDRTCYSFFILKNTERSSREARREVFLKALNDLSLGRDPTRESGPLYLIPEDRRRIIDSLKGPIDMPHQRRALLQRLELASTKSTHPKIDEATCEHVLPCRIKRSSNWAKTFDNRSHREHVNLLGNLVLLNKRQNELAGNKSYEEKKRMLFRSNRQRFFESAKDLRQFDEWTPAVIRERTLALAGRLASAWEL